MTPHLLFLGRFAQYASLTAIVVAVATCASQPAIILPPSRPKDLASNTSAGANTASLAGTEYIDPYASESGGTPLVPVDPANTKIDPVPVIPEQLAAEQQRLKDKTMAIYRRAQGLHRSGKYAAAEKLLTRALTLYPFNADVNLLLGKIYLLKGYANRDPAMLSTARLMFEMAGALEPELQEPRLLLKLFKRPHPNMPPADM